jgi:hypothetical protein
MITSSLSAWLSSSAFRWQLPLLVLLLLLPTFWTGLSFDDYQQRRLLQEHQGFVGLATASQSFFVFLDGDPVNAQARINRGELAWWTLPHARNAFWRPLSVFTHWLDYQIWPNQVPLMHVHSLLWYIALVMVVRRLYQQIGGSQLAVALASLLYAIDDARGFGVAWLANRNAICSTFFGVCMLIWAIGWQTSQRPRDLIWALCFWVCALLSGEASIAALGYLLAYQIWLNDQPWSRRLRLLAPFMLVLIFWKAVYSWLGFSAWGTSYVDPLREPIAYIYALVSRVPLLLGGQWLQLPSESLLFLPPIWRWTIWLLVIALLVVLAKLVWPLLRADSQARFWATGMLFALLPASSALPANRLLFWVGLGASALLARWLVWFAQEAGRQQKLKRFALGLHLYVAALLLPMYALSPIFLGALPELPATVAAQQHDLIALNAPSVWSLSGLAGEASAPPSMRVNHLVLAPGPGRIEVTRSDQYTFVVEKAEGFLLGYDWVFRAEWHPLQVQQQIELDRVVITIQEQTFDQRPKRVQFRFKQVLEAQQVAWLLWQKGRFETWQLPAIGETRWYQSSLR